MKPAITPQRLTGLITLALACAEAAEDQEDADAARWLLDKLVVGGLTEKNMTGTMRVLAKLAKRMRWKMWTHHD